MAESTLELILRIRKQGTGAKDAQGELGILQKSAVSLQGAVASLAGPAGVGLLAAGLKFAVGEAMQAELVMAATENVIRATGGAAGLTAEQVSVMAGKLSMLTGVEDEAVQEGQNLLLTFKEIKGQTFEAASRSMLDMAVAMNKGSLEGVDLKATAIQLGKALNVQAGDTAAAARAIGALTKVGVSFSSAQKKAAAEAIKFNDVAAYQAIVLGELESEFGGAAEAAGNTTAGAFAKLKTAVGNLAEEMGTKLLPWLTKAADALTLLITWNNQVQGALAEHADQVRASTVDYQAYSEELIRAAEAAGYEVNASGDLVETYHGRAGAVQEVVQANYMLIESEFAATQATYDHEDAIARMRAEQTLLATETQTVTMTEGEWKTAMGELNALIGGQLGPELEKFRDKQGELVAKGEELRAKIGELEAKQWLTAAQKTELETLREELGANNEAVAGNAAAHEEATRRILFSLLQQRLGMALTAGTITEDQLPAINTALNEVALNWGLVDQQTFAAINSIDAAIAGLRDGSIAGFMNDLYDIAGPVLTDTVIPAVNELDAALGTEESLARTINEDTVPAINLLSKQVGVLAGGLAETKPGMIWIIRELDAQSGLWAGTINNVLVPALNKLTDSAGAANEGLGQLQDKINKLYAAGFFSGGGGGVGELNPNPDYVPENFPPVPQIGNANHIPQVQQRFQPIRQAEGGDWWVTRPTMFLAGEAGPERATFTPAGQFGGGSVTLTIPVVLDGREVTRIVVDNIDAELRAKGRYIPAVP